MEPVWQGGFPIQTDIFGGQLGTSGAKQEDWEDWLRWDPTLEPTSPEDGTVNSGSSKNASPIQNAVLPLESEILGKNETLAPPMIMGEDAMDIGTHIGVGDGTFLFGASEDGMAQFDFQPLGPIEHPQANIPKIDTDFAAWPTTSNLDTENITLSAISNENYASLPSAGAVSSTAPSIHYSPESTTQNRTSLSSNSPEPVKKRGGRKRKAELEQEAKDEIGDSPEDGDGPPVKKTSHNVIEKRYRNNLNDKIVELRNSVPSLRAMGKANRGDDTEDLEGLTAAHKLNKATVMAKATEYIRHLEKRNKTMSDEMDALRARLANIEASIGKSTSRRPSMTNSPTGRARQASSSSQNSPQNFLNISPEQSRYNQQVVQHQYMQGHSQPTYVRQPGPPVEAQNQPQYVNGRGGGSIMNKVMLGTMAGVMVMEGFSEHQSNDDGSARGLFSVPTQFFKRNLDTSLPPSSTGLPSSTALPLMKFFLVVGALLYLILPLLSYSTPAKRKARTSAIRLPHAPSLASPIEVRRKAWLTAIQTVWVPKHFLLEVIAVTSKMISLSLRRLIGSEAFNTLTGANKDDEIARIKAWDIAIDAQLAGGDQEVSYYRLLLTLMESGTLPDSPTRLMQKAVHFRVFFWEVANAGYGNMIGFKQFTERVGKFYWESARRQQRELVQAKSRGRPTPDDEDEVDLLPDHLASLVELDCDEVLSDEMIQRAWNLAWNKPSDYCAITNAARDAVVEDHAIRSPLDAVAAWYANMTVDDTLTECLNEHASTLDNEYYIGLAVSIAPPASATLARTLAAKAVLSNVNRDTNILIALDALPAVSSSSGEMNVVSHIPAAPDVRTALTIAKLLALMSPKASAVAHDRAMDFVAALHLPPGSFTLLTAVAAFRLLKCLGAAQRLPIDTSQGVEDLAANLRIWVGTSAGRNAGMGADECAQIVNLCLQIAKKTGGWDERDSGYGSADYTSPECSPVRERPGVAI